VNLRICVIGFIKDYDGCHFGGGEKFARERDLGKRFCEIIGNLNFLFKSDQQIIDMVFNDGKTMM
jgi:hypothetical protein